MPIRAAQKIANGGLDAASRMSNEPLITNRIITAVDNHTQKHRAGWRQWIADESFWRDVASRSLSGLIVATIIFVVGITGGWLKAPPHLRLVASILTGATALFLIFAIASGVGGTETTLDEAYAHTRRRTAARRRNAKKSQARQVASPGKIPPPEHDQGS